MANMANIPYNSILQWNCRVFFHKRFQLKHLISITQPFIVCLQETLALSPNDLTTINDLFKDFIIYFKHRIRPGVAHPRGGVAILVHKSVPHRLLQIRSNLEAIAVSIKYNKNDIGICSLYLPRSRVFTVQLLTELSAQLGTHHMLMGDFNAYHVSWGSVANDAEGVKVIDFVNTTDNVILNTGEPTHICDRTGNTSCIDLSICSPRMSLDTEWYTYTDTLGSDHLPIFVKIGAANLVDENFRPMCIYKTDDVDWGPYALFDLDISGENADEMCHNITASILSAAEEALPHVSTRTNRVLVPWWRPKCREAIKLRNRAYRKFHRAPTDENYILYKKYRALARLVIKTAKRNSWRDFVSTKTRDTPTTKIWNFVKRLKGKSFTRPIFLETRFKISGIFISNSY